MFKKYEVLRQIEDAGIVAVLRSESEEKAVEVAKACIAGGVNLIEITFSVPAADQVIRTLVRNPDTNGATIGAGTVLDPISCRLAILAGAKFVVGPTFDAAVAQMCNLYGVPYIPGCETVNEMQEALKHGVDLVKLFPATQFKPGIVKAIKAPLPQVNILVTGGINVENTPDWISGGACAIAVGGNLTKLDASAADPYAKIKQAAADFKAAIAAGRAQ